MCQDLGLACGMGLPKASDEAAAKAVEETAKTPEDAAKAPEDTAKAAQDVTVGDKRYLSAEALDENPKNLDKIVCATHPPPHLILLLCADVLCCAVLCCAVLCCGAGHVCVGYHFV